MLRSRPIGVEDLNTESLKTILAPRVNCHEVSLSEDLPSSSLLLSILSLLPPKQLWNLSQALYPLYYDGPQDLTLPECPQSPPNPLSPDLIIHSSQHCSQRELPQMQMNQLWIKLLLAPQGHQKSE